MIGLAADPNYIVVSNAVCDSRGNVWTSIVLAGDKNLLAVRSSAGTWSFIPAMIGGIKMSNLMDRPVDRCLGVDAFDNIWAIVRDAAYRGVISLGNAGNTGQHRRIPSHRIERTSEQRGQDAPGGP